MILITKRKEMTPPGTAPGAVAAIIGAVRAAPGAIVLTVLALTGLCASIASPRTVERQAAYGRSVAVRIIQPGAAPVATPVLAGPPTARGSAGSFAFPDGGSAVSVQSANGTAAVDVRHAAVESVGELTGVSLFGGEITADAISSRTSASAHAGLATGDSQGTAIENLVVLGQAVQAVPDLSVPLGDWGRAELLARQTVSGTTYGVPSFHQTMVALTVTLLADHGGLTAGTRIELGRTEAFARLPLATRPLPARQSVPRTAPAGPEGSMHRSTRAGRNPEATPPPREADRLDGGIPFSPLLAGFDIATRMTANRYVFPVYGPAAYGDTFGAPRADTGWHHGDDLFAPLGSPVLAVTDGTLFSVGWQKIGGNRFWLRDRKGNEFYYAHLAAYSPLAANGADVKAGDVVGFLGNSGDAEGTPFHLHFEIHPSALIFLGYDGVVDPTPYLDAWRRVLDIRFPTGMAWAPALAPHSQAPEPGAILIQARDISSADGLDPGSLQRALKPVPAEGTGVRTSPGG
jgi:murein DD-endopeptidase MepM/ murein hydrolase activator NlpD